MSHSRYTLLIDSFINSLIDLKKFQSVSRTCASGVSYYISSSCFSKCGRVMLQMENLGNQLTNRHSINIDKF